MRGGSLTLRSCSCARQRCSFVSGSCVNGTMITAGVAVAVAGAVGVTTSVAAGSLSAVGSDVAVAITVAANSAVVCASGVVLGTLFAVMMGNAELFGRRVGCICTGEGAPICIGCPQPANTNTINSKYQRRTLANTDSKNNCSSAFYHVQIAVSSRSRQNPLPITTTLPRILMLSGIP